MTITIYIHPCISSFIHSFIHSSVHSSLIQRIPTLSESPYGIHYTNFQISMKSLIRVLLALWWLQCIF